MKIKKKLNLQSKERNNYTIPFIKKDWNIMGGNKKWKTQGRLNKLKESTIHCTKKYG